MMDRRRYQAPPTWNAALADPSSLIVGTFVIFVAFAFLAAGIFLIGASMGPVTW